MLSRKRSLGKLTNMKSTAELVEVDQRVLKETVGKSAFLQAFFSHLDSKTTDTHRAIEVQWLFDTANSRWGLNLQWTDVVTALRGLQKSGCGKFIVGRRGHDSRFEFFGGAKRAVSFLSSLEESVESLGPVVASDVFIVEHVYLLRPQTKLSVLLPSDISEREAKRLAMFARSLSFANSAELSEAKLEHRYVLRSGFNPLVLVLPENLTQFESRKLARFLESLA